VDALTSEWLHARLCGMSEFDWLGGLLRCKWVCAGLLRLGAHVVAAVRISQCLSASAATLIISPGCLLSAYLVLMWCRAVH
jgi:hypothetical protein